MLEIAFEDAKADNKKRNPAEVGTHEKGFSVIRIYRVIRIPTSTCYKAKESTLSI